MTKTLSLESCKEKQISFNREFQMDSKDLREPKYYIRQNKLPSLVLRFRSQAFMTNIGIFYSLVQSPRHSHPLNLCRKTPVK